MNILAIDTSCDVLSAAINTETGIWHTEIDDGTRHSELLLAIIDKLCSLCGIAPEKLNLILCTEGPGSFTGLRIGFSTVKGLGMALGVPVKAIPTLDCLAYSLKFYPGIVIPAIDAKKKCFFTALYRGEKRLTGYMDSSPETIALALRNNLLFKDENVVLTGSGAGILGSALQTEFPAEFSAIKIDSRAKDGRAKELIRMAKNDILYCTDIFDSGPVYIRKSDAELNRG